MKKSILLSLVLLVSSTQAHDSIACNIKKFAKDARSYVTGLATQAGAGLQNGVSFVQDKVAKNTPAAVTNAVNSTRDAAVEFNTNHPHVVKAAAVAAVVAVGYVVYKKFCPVTKRGCCTTEHKN